MIFTVPENFEGSLVLNTLKRALSKGMTVSISGNDLYANDIKIAIRQGVLVSVNGDYNEEMANISSEVVIVNMTDRVLILGEIVLNPNGSLSVSKDISETGPVHSAEKSKLIRIISDSKVVSKKDAKKSIAKNKAVIKKKVEEIEEEVFEEETQEDNITHGAEREVKAKVWNFREQDAEDAFVVPNAPDMLRVDEEEEIPDVDFVDEPESHPNVDFVDESVEVQKVSVKKVVKKKSVKKVTKKKEVKKTIKKKGKATKKKKVKAIEPVGDKKLPKTQMDADYELDSRGKPLGKASDALNSLIDSLGSEE